MDITFSPKVLKTLNGLGVEYNKVNTLKYLPKRRKINWESDNVVRCLMSDFIDL